MTKKDYKLVASALRVAKPWIGSEGRFKDLVNLFCQTLGVNPRFDPEKFKKACGG